MPCTCDGHPEPEPDIHNGPMSEMLCSIKQEHEARGEMSCFTKDQLKWWEDHKKRDRDRVQQDLKEANHEKDRQKAISKLTDYEKSLLGLE